MKRAFQIGGILVIIGLIMAAIGFFSHRQPFNPLTNPGQNTRTTLTTKKFDRVKVTAASADVVVKQGAGYAVKYYGTRHPAIKTQVKDNQLTVTQTHITKSKHVHFFDDRDDRVVITIPKGAKLANLTVTANGDLSVNDLNLASAKVTANGGDVTVNDSKINGGQLVTDAGDLTINRSKLIATEVKTDSGDIDLARVTVNAGKATLASGDLNADRVTVKGHYRVTNQSGDSEVNTVNHPGAILTSDSGDSELGHRRNDDGGTIQRDTTNPNLVHLVNQSGDNSLK